MSYSFFRFLFLAVLASGLCTGALAQKSSKTRVETEYYPDGEPLSQTEFVGDSKHGKYQEFYESRNLKVFGQYKEGKREGEWSVFFNFRGKPLSSTTIYRAGKKHGLHREFSSKGRLVLEIEYKDGEAIQPKTPNLRSAILDFALVQDDAKIQLAAAAMYGEIMMTREILRMYPVLVNQPLKEEATALFIAAKEDNLEVVREIMAHKPNLETRFTKFKDTILHYAALKNKDKLIKELCAESCPLELRARKAELTPLAVAILSKNAEAARTLIELGASLEEPAQGQRAIHMAAGRGMTDLVELMISKGEDMNLLSEDKFGVTPLQSAAFAGHLDTTKLLIAKGADPNIISKNGSTALLDAMKKKHREVEKYLRLYGAKTIEELNAN